MSPTQGVRDIAAPRRTPQVLHNIASEGTSGGGSRVRQSPKYSTPEVRGRSPRMETGIVPSLVMWGLAGLLLGLTILYLVYIH